MNEKGIAEVKISLLSNASILKAIANKYMMSGDKDEGDNHEYYVTASYAGKLQKASQINVDVVNPAHQPKPKDDSPKFPPTNDSKTKPQPDPKGNIKDAYFVNDKNQKLSSVQLNTHVKVQILSSNLIGKYIQYVVWEKDFGVHDEIFRNGKIKTPGDICNIGGFKITESHFQKGIDLSAGDPDSDKQNYFLEIIVLDSTAESKKFGLDDKAPQQMEVVRSASIVKEEELEQKDNKGNCIPCQIGLTVQDLDKFMTATPHGSILNVAPYNTIIPSYISYLHQYMTEFEINKIVIEEQIFWGKWRKKANFGVTRKISFINPVCLKVSLVISEQQKVEGMLIYGVTVKINQKSPKKEK